MNRWAAVGGDDRPGGCGAYRCTNAFRGCVNACLPRGGHGGARSVRSAYPPFFAYHMLFQQQFPAFYTLARGRKRKSVLYGVYPEWFI